jgi:hypothetical protein
VAKKLNFSFINHRGQPVSGSTSIRCACSRLWTDILLVHRSGGSVTWPSPSMIGIVVGAT